MSRSVLLVLLGFALAAVAGAVAGATIPDSAGVIHACVSSSSGTSANLRIIDSEAPQTCTGGEQSLDWNRQGRPGADGPAGPPGASPRVVHFSREKPLRLPLKRGTPVAELDIPQGEWLVSAGGQIELTPQEATWALRSTPVACSIEAGNRKTSVLVGNEFRVSRKNRLVVRKAEWILDMTLPVVAPAGGLKVLIRCGYTNDGRLPGGTRAGPPVWKSSSFHVFEMSHGAGRDLLIGGSTVLERSR